MFLQSWDWVFNVLVTRLSHHLFFNYSDLSAASFNRSLFRCRKNIFRLSEFLGGYTDETLNESSLGAGCRRISLNKRLKKCRNAEPGVVRSCVFVQYTHTPFVNLPLLLFCTALLNSLRGSEYLWVFMVSSLGKTSTETMLRRSHEFVFVF